MIKMWLNSIGKLPWAKGELDSSSWLAAVKAARMKVPDEIAFDEIARRIKAAGDLVNVDKVSSQIRRAKLAKTSIAPNPTGGVKFDAHALATIAANIEINNPAAEIVNRSIRRPVYLSSADALFHLYAPGEKVLVFEDQCRQGILWQRDDPDAIALPINGANGVFFLINPVDGESHFNPRQDKSSNRSEESVTSFKYLLLESDKANEADWLRFLIQLPIPISGIYRSGGKSVHALVRIDAKRKQEWDAIVAPYKRRLARVGADAKALTAVRLSRLPQAYRGERQQELLFLNPAPTATPIMDLPLRPLWRDWVDYIDVQIRANAVTDKDRSDFSDATIGRQNQPEVARLMAILEVENA